MEVNSVQINIPTGLYRDLRFSIQIAEKTRNKAFLEDDKILEFIYCDNFRIESLNEFFCLFLKSYNLIAIDKDVESYPVEPIMDAALFNMVVNGSNPALISKINGVKISSLEKKF
ncbi:hypothetical protein EXW96_25145 [Paenibacillus sp. JMULE4]|uniref:hypothetical protein n=1 Tax=Paenibacillus sp. JMULE4 TaxID=2518342 RepID=UPI0015767FE6|nr:hypothetical protein [Paenibacillus sp. JMULE4]NTZ20680.1 hypothetical protein [Paenibacillus sp. JMULE4]